MKAADILEAAQGHMLDRASTYDKPEGERSMGATVEAFNAITGHKLTEEQGWLLMILLKATRSQQGAYRSDSYEDGAAYFALAGEAAYRDRAPGVPDERHPMTPNVISYPAQDWPADESRIDVIGQNGNGGEHYKAPDHRRRAGYHCDNCTAEHCACVAR